ncbi:hypothetical protein RRG08_034399 [Elysia crispata]|uniref:Uncharacterized protein n=1 Tax=Elysia crispata TaxID=231223 RepID=A0AAE0YCV6_9GAST|nr:hypothetical protein RRG08_034399 [Elysia crispata]
MERWRGKRIRENTVQDNTKTEVRQGEVTELSTCHKSPAAKPRITITFLLVPGPWHVLCYFDRFSWSFRLRLPPWCPYCRLRPTPSPQTHTFLSESYFLTLTPPTNSHNSVSIRKNLAVPLAHQAIHFAQKFTLTPPSLRQRS